MKKRIYLFCNDGYGGAYLAAFQTQAEKLSEYECCVIFSAKGPAPSIFRRLAKAIRHPFRYGISHFRPSQSCFDSMTILRARDVNSPDFYETVPKGSIGFICGFNQVFKKPTIDRFSSFLNFHPSLLPCYRGAIPSYWVIRNREPITGFTAHVVTEAIDAGEIVYQELVEVDPDISEAELDRKIAAVGSVYLAECLTAIETGKPFRHKFVNAQYAQKIGYTPPHRE